MKSPRAFRSCQDWRWPRWLPGVQVLLLGLAAWRNGHQLNPDAIAYLRLAGYYAQGDLALAVTGYWGPLLSWLMAPFLWLGIPEIWAARTVMSLSAIVFLLGSVRLFVAAGLTRGSVLGGAIITGCASVLWSVRNISPDLLLGGLGAFAITPLMNGDWLKERRQSAVAGVCWGLAYLAKAVALPWGMLVVLAWSALAWRGGAGTRRIIAARCGTVGLAFLLVAGGWIGVLSLKYGRPTFSTTGVIAHAIAGPPDVPRYHPTFSTLHVPEPGRLTSWEEPSRLPYATWKPWQSRAYLAHQGGLMVDNALIMLGWTSGVNLAVLTEIGDGLNPRLFLKLLPGFDLLALSLLGMVACLCQRPWLWSKGFTGRWRLAVLPVGLLALLYLPFYVSPSDQRYFYPACPFFWIAVAGCGEALIHSRRWRGAARAKRVALRVGTISFMLPAMLWAAAGLRGVPNPANQTAIELAKGLRRSGVMGPVAGSCLMAGGRTGFYLAWHLRQAWLGDSLTATTREWLASPARVLLFSAESGIARELIASGRFERLGAGEGIVVLVRKPGDDSNRDRVPNN